MFKHSFSMMWLGLSLFLVVGSACKSEKKPFFRSSLSALESQVFTIDAGKPEVIKGKGGSIFAIPAGAFFDEMGNSVSGDITIKLKEARNIGDMFRSGLQTMSASGLLETDGSYEILAVQCEKVLKLDPDAGIYAFFPTQQKMSGMKLWNGTVYNETVAWDLGQEIENGIPECEASPAARKHCLKCEKLLKLSQKIKTGKKPGEDDYYAKRYYMENGKLYFYSSGSSEQLFSQKDLEECKKYLMARDRGRELLEKVAAIQQEQKDKVADYYNFKLDRLGWCNIDRLMKEVPGAQLITFTGSVIGPDEKPVENANVHFISKGRKIHVMKTAKDGTFSFEYIPGEYFKIYAYDEKKSGKDEYYLKHGDLQIEPLTINPTQPEEALSFLEDLM